MESPVLPYDELLVEKSVEFVMTLAKVVAATVVLNQTKGEHSEAKWIIAYTYACIANLPILCWRIWQTNNPVAGRRVKRELSRLETMLNVFFVGWFMVFSWVFVASSSSLDHTSKLYWLCVVFLAYGCMRYLFNIVITCALMCFCVSAVVLCVCSVIKLYYSLEELLNWLRRLLNLLRSLLNWLRSLFEYLFPR